MGLTRTYKVGRIQDAVLHWVGQVQGELPHSALLGLLANGWPLLFDLMLRNNYKKSSY